MLKEDREIEQGAYGCAAIVLLSILALVVSIAVGVFCTESLSSTSGKSRWIARTATTITALRGFVKTASGHDGR